MNLYEAIFELYGYVKSVQDRGQDIDKVKNCISGKDFDSPFYSLPDKSQWIRILSSLECIVSSINEIKGK